MHYESQQPETPSALTWEPDNRITWNFIQDFCPVAWGSCKSVTLSTEVPQLRVLLPKSLFYGDTQGCTFFPLNSAIASHNQYLCQASSSLPWGRKTILPISKVNTLASSCCLLCRGAIPVLLENASHRVRERKQVSNPDLKPQRYFSWEMEVMEPTPPPA